MGNCKSAGAADRNMGKAKVYGLTLSSNAMSPILFAQDSGVGKMQFLDLMAGAHKAPDFLEKNPFHTVPTYEGGDGFCLGESNAMLRFMAANYATKYYPADAKLRARIDWAMDAISSTVYKKWTPRVYPVLGFSQNPEDQAKANEDLKSALDMFAKTFIGSGKFICGDTLTIADYKAVPYLFCLTHPMIHQKSGIKLSPRLEQYVHAAMGAMASSGMLKAAGGYGLEEFLHTKKELEDYKGTVLVGGEGTCSSFAKGPAKAKETSAKIHGVALSANCVGCVLFARDTGLGDMEMCNLMTGEQLKPEFLAKNPFHQVPTFESSDGFNIGESSAILRYLAVNYKPEFYPQDPKVRGRVDWALDVITTGIYEKISYPIFYPVFGFAPAPPADQKKANAECTELLDTFEKCFLASGKFVAGEKLTIADYKLVPFLFAASQPIVEQKTGFKLSPRLSQYVEDCTGAMKSSSFLSSAGGYSLKEYAASKA